jgi:cystathionine beta-lyase
LFYDRIYQIGGVRVKYDFNRVYDRCETNCEKWDSRKSIFGHDDVIPMWVADMDFPAAAPIVEALKKRTEHPFYGYTKPGDEVIDSVIERMRRKYNWIIQPEWVVFTPGVIPALNGIVRSLTHPGDEIILQEPVYFPFFSVVNSSGCHVASNPLKLVDGRYHMDFEGLAQIFKPKNGLSSHQGHVKAMILCNPHNPIGRLWSRDELIRMGEIVIKNGAVVISDEIHCEILFKGKEHTPFAKISEEFEQNSIICMSPSKTFNLAGIGVSSIIIPNKKLREGFSNIRVGIMPQPNLFGYSAMEAAFRYGDEWLEQLLEYLQGNLDFMLDYFARKIPQIKVIRPDGTYLVWLDCRDLGLDDTGLKDFMRNKARVGLVDGYLFGSTGAGFQRMNIACPRSILEEALNRIESAVSAL